MLLHDCLRPRNRSIRTRGCLHSCLDPLLGMRRAMVTEQQVLGDFTGEFRIRLPPDPGYHQVENGRRAGAGNPVTAAYIELRYRAGLRVVFLKADNVVPMHGNIVSVEEPRLGEYQAAVFDPADLDTEPGDSPEPADDLALAHDAVRIEARQYEHGLAVFGDGEISVDRNEPAVAGADWFAVRGNDFPLEHRSLRQPVGDEQRFGCGGNTEIGELRQEQKRHFHHRHLCKNSPSS